jgi:hypothetical protein
MKMRLRKYHIPLFIRFEVIICLVGLAFPIYGFPIAGAFKLTVFRIGLPLLLVAALSKGRRIKSHYARYLLVLASILAALTFISLAWSQFPNRGIQQLEWFAEGWLYLWALGLLSSKYPSLPRFYLKCTFAIGLVSIGFMAAQFIALQFHRLITLPLSDSIFGISTILRPWTYPLGGGGRILGAFYEPNMSGSMCAFYLAAFGPFLLANRQGAVIRRFWTVIAVIVAAVAMIGTGSRQSMVVTGATMLLIVAIALRRGGHVLRRGARQALAIVTFLLLVYMAFGGFQATTTPFGELEQNVFVRFAESAGFSTGGRWDAILLVLRALTPRIVLFGAGAGTADFTAHNAYLLTLYQSGILALLVLIGLSAVFILASLHATWRQKDNPLFYAGVASTCIAATWVGLIFMNWAQLNQSVSYMYLAIPLLFLTASREESEEDPQDLLGSR